MEKFPLRFGLVMLSMRYRRERFTAVARVGEKGDTGVIPRARLTKWTAFIAFLVCRGEEAGWVFPFSVYRCARRRCEWRSQFVVLHGLTLLLQCRCALIGC